MAKKPSVIHKFRYSLWTLSTVAPSNDTFVSLYQIAPRHSIPHPNNPYFGNKDIALFQILILQRGGFIFDDYLEVVESVTSLASKLDRIRVHGYQEGDTTPVDDQESIRRHHTTWFPR